MTLDLKAEEHLRRDVEAGDLCSVIEAFKLVATGQMALPEWLLNPILEALEFTFEHRGGAGDRVKASQRAKNMQRYALADFWLKNRELLPELGYPATRAGVFEMIADDEGTVTAKAVEHSYDRVRATLKCPQNSEE